ncbi:MAG TPA: single-stranded DNA-binding protein [Clostridiaceae bacterium]|jgi:single-strand DNA-binding protein|nr:single-stranded DNA-binding protein [Clostridiaceae bacterium]
MNKVVLIGRLTKDPELRYTPSNIPVCRITLAVDRRYRSENQQQTADFINCVAWRSTAEFISKYFTKGSRIAVAGRIETSSWEDQEGKRRYSTDVVIDEVEFADSKRHDGPTNDNMPGYGAESQPQQAGFFVLDEDDGDIPF